MEVTALPPLPWTGSRRARSAAVVEDTSGLPPGTVVTYDPPGADTTGVTISGQGAGVQVTITNEYTNIPVQTGTVQITKVVAPNVPAGVVLPATFTAEVVCDDGTHVLVTMPGSGGPGTPIVHPEINALCVLEETGIEQFPAQQIVSYSVDGGPPMTGQPTFVITGTQTVNVTITNDVTRYHPPKSPEPSLSNPASPVSESQASARPNCRSVADVVAIDDARPVVALGPLKSTSSAPKMTYVVRSSLGVVCACAGTATKTAAADSEQRRHDHDHPTCEPT